MAVETGHLNLFAPQLTQDGNAVSPLNQVNVINHLHGGPQMLFPGNTVAFPANNSQFYQPVVCEGKTSVNTDSGLTYNVPPPRKRSRDATGNQMYPAVNFISPQKNSGGAASQFPAFVGEDELPQIQHHQLDIDEIISQHTKKMRVELYQRQKHQARLLMAAIEEKVMSKLKEKDEQIHGMGKLNLVLQERVKSLYVENQLWRDLAQTNEAAANSLRTNLEQVLAAAHIGGKEHASAAEDDAESCCSSNDHEEREVIEPTGETTSFQKKGGSDGCNYGARRCRKCGERESCVLLLPCRHLCLCGPCGSGAHQLRDCPVCHASMNATLHVNMSS